MSPEKIYIILPCFNESEVIRNTIAGLLPYKYKVVVINDGSSQNILEKVSDLPIIYCEHKINLGQGAALLTGTELALKKGAEIIVHFDSDGQHSAEDIDTMIQPILQHKADVVIGSRFLNEKDKGAIPVKRRRLLKVARIVNYLLTGVQLTDAHNGFRALSRNAAEKIKIRENRMAHASEILVLIRKNKLSYTERPTHIIYSEYSKEKGQSPFNAINIVIDLILNKIFR
jgi:polyprenyl-phospho-N-acetylgalactosaminyl synthase